MMVQAPQGLPRNPMSKIRFIALCTVALLSAACSGIGDGSKPESLKVIQTDGIRLFTQEILQAPAKPGQVTTCIGGTVGAFVFFSDGGIGNFSFRVKWTSDNPAVVRVSNNDIEIAGGGLFFVPGALVPVAPGTANVTAEYAGLTSTIPVTVSALDVSSVKFVPEKATLAPLSFQNFGVTAMVDGKPTNITSVTTLGFDEPDDAVAILSNGAVTGVGVGELALNARFNAGDCATLTAPVRVAELTSLAADYEEGFTGDMVSNTTQFLRITGNFGDLDGDGEEETQDLSVQSTTTSSDSTVFSVGGLLSGRNLAFASDPEGSGTANFVATFGAGLDPDGAGPLPADPVGVTSPALPITVRDATFSSLAITPTDPVSIEPLGNVSLKAIGTYTAADSVERTLDITRHVAWTTDDAAKAVVGSGISATAGTVLSITEDEGSTVVTAKLIQGTADATPPAAGDTPDLTQTKTITIAAPVAAP